MRRWALRSDSGPVRLPVIGLFVCVSFLAPTTATALDPQALTTAGPPDWLEQPYHWHLPGLDDLGVPTIQTSRFYPELAAAIDRLEAAGADRARTEADHLVERTLGDLLRFLREGPELSRAMLVDIVGAVRRGLLSQNPTESSALGEISEPHLVAYHEPMIIVSERHRGGANKLDASDLPPGIDAFSTKVSPGELFRRLRDEGHLAAPLRITSDGIVATDWLLADSDSPATLSLYTVHDAHPTLRRDRASASQRVPALTHEALRPDGTVVGFEIERWKPEIASVGDAETLAETVTRIGLFWPHSPNGVDRRVEVFVAGQGERLYYHRVEAYGETNDPSLEGKRWSAQTAFHPIAGYLFRTSPGLAVDYALPNTGPRSRLPTISTGQDGPIIPVARRVWANTASFHDALLRYASQRDTRHLLR